MARYICKIEAIEATTKYKISNLRHPKVHLEEHPKVHHKLHHYIKYTCHIPRFGAC